MRQVDQVATPRRLTTVEQVEGIVGRPASMVMLKQISALDDGCRAILARCPIAAVGYRDVSGTSRTTFIGGTPGFTRVHSPTRISFALAEPGDPYGPVSFFFLLPGVGEILRVNGTVVTRQGARTTVDIKQAYVHCAQAVLRSRLWQPPTSVGPPTVAEIAGDGPLVHHELYTSAAGLNTSAADRATAPAVPWQMAVEQDGQPVATVLVEPGQTLLDAGLAAGLPMPYSCTVGNCGECVVKLRAGQVAQHEPNCLTPRQQADGYVLTWVGRPMSKVTLDIADP